MSTARPEVAPLRPHDDPCAAITWWSERTDLRSDPYGEWKPLFAYFIQDGEDGAVKIGKAFNPVSRLSELQCGNPRKLTLRSVILAHYCTEENLHMTWREYRIRGEWFGSGLRGKGEPDRYPNVFGCTRIQTADHPSVQKAILALAREAQIRQIEAAITGASESDIHTISDLVRPPAEWPEIKARNAKR